MKSSAYCKKTTVTTERQMEVNGTLIHLRSIFVGQTKLDDALQKIIDRRLSETDNG